MLSVHYAVLKWKCKFIKDQEVTYLLSSLSLETPLSKFQYLLILFFFYWFKYNYGLKLF